MTRPQVLDALADRIDAVSRPHPVRVAIDGVDAAGKTTLADELVAPLMARGRPVIRASIDRFHHPAAVRMRRGPESPEGYYHDSFDEARLTADLLDPLGPGGSRRYRREAFDHRTDRAIDCATQEAEPRAVLLFDGVFLLRPSLFGHWDLSIFVRADFAVTVARAEVRDAALLGSPADVRRRYAKRYVPGQRLYLEACRPERLASIVVDNDDPAHPRIADRP